MKIAFFHELHFGGARRVVFEYGKVFEKNHTTSLFYVGDKEQQEASEIFTENIFYHYTSPSYLGKSFKTKFYKDFIEPFKLYFLHKRIARQIDKGQFDFVFVHQSQFTGAPFLLRFLKTPTVFYCQEPLRIIYDPAVNTLPRVSPVKKLYEMLSRKVKKIIDASNIKYADVILANSAFSKKNIKNAYHRDAALCYLGVDPQVFHPVDLKKVYDILFVAEPVWTKGYDLLEKALKYFDKKPVVHVVKKDKKGHISDEALAVEYNKAKVVVALSRNEPFGLTPIEAMACSVPVIGVAEGGLQESIIDDKTGLLIHRDGKELHEALEKLLKNDSLRQKMGENGRKEVISHWTWEQSAERVFNAIKKSDILKHE